MNEQTISSATLMFSVATEYGHIAMQAYGFCITVNVAALGWAVATRRDGHPGVALVPALLLGILVFLVSAWTAASAMLFQERSDLALSAARAALTGAGGANSLMQSALGPTFIELHRFLGFMADEANLANLAMAGAAALGTAAMASRLWRS